MKLIGLLLSLLVVGALVYSMVPSKGSAAGGAGASASLGAPPPTDIARNPKGATDYTKRQACLADCAAEDRTCRSLAFEPPAVEKCDATKTVCDERCP